MFDKLLDIIFPPKCVGCGRNRTHLCINCINTLPTSKPIGIENIFALFSYRNKTNETIKKALWSLKYKHNKPLAKTLAQVFYDFILEEIYELNVFSQAGNNHRPIIIPIPLSKKRLKERGYNQIEMIAKELSLIDKNKSFTVEPNVLYKIKDTPTQVSIKDRSDRLKNLTGCFDVSNNEIIKNKSIILIDDITTTGATFNEASKTLEKAGAGKIICIAIAH